MQTYANERGLRPYTKRYNGNHFVYAIELKETDDGRPIVYVGSTRQL